MANRYQRQTVLSEIGAEGQAKLAAARVVVVGCGGLGSPAAAYLAGAGVGQLRLVDGDRPDLTNLHRQVFFDPALPESKATQLANYLRRLNADIGINAVERYLDGQNVRRVFAGASLVLDCTDDATTKHLINDACVILGIPLVYAAAQGYAGYVALFPNDADGVNLRDLYAEPDPTLPDCATAGVLPTAVGIVAMLQANAALCYLLGIGDPPIDRLLTYNALDNSQHRMRLQKTYGEAIQPPWTAQQRVNRQELEIAADTLTPPGFAGIFSMLTEGQEPELPEGVIRLDSRNPFGQCMDVMVPGNRYLLYCNSGKLSLVLAAQLTRQNSALEVVSLRGGIQGIIPEGP